MARATKRGCFEVLEGLDGAGTTTRGLPGQGGPLTQERLALLCAADRVDHLGADIGGTR